MRQRILTILCRILGAVCHPLWMPTYGIILFCAVFSQTTSFPTAYWLFAVLGTFFLTALVPLTMIIIRYFAGTVTSLEIRNASERTPVYIYTVVCYLFWCYYLSAVLHAPIVLLLIAIGASLALLGVLIVNRRWKISAHLTGLGGLIGGISAYCMHSGHSAPVGLICGLLGLALILMYARLYTDSHTSLQVVAGLLWGVLMTMFPALVYALI